MKLKLLGVLGALLLVIGIWSVTSMHSVEAKGIPKYWLNCDGTIKSLYLKTLKSTPANTKFPIPALKTDCKK